MLSFENDVIFLDIRIASELQTMKVIIVEDEISAHENLIYLLHQIDPSIEIIKVLDGVRSAIEYFRRAEEVDLLFMDVQLGDGIAFEIFESVSISTPIIFTTAFDQYAIRAFKLNSVDYLLKPINKGELENGLAKFRNQDRKTSLDQIQSILEELKGKSRKYKATFLVDQREYLIPISVKDIAFFYMKSGLVRGATFESKSFLIDRKMEDLETELDPTIFYRINRQFIIHRAAFKKIYYGINGKLSISLIINFEGSIVVSKAKAKHFKNWMTGVS